MSNIIGIDLGTTFSAIAKLDDHGQPHIIPVDGERIMASCVWVQSNSNCVVGKEAYVEIGQAPKSVIRRFKRKMGSDQTYEPIPGIKITPVSASAMILRKLAQEASKSEGEIKDVVITVPANFAEWQRKATIEAGKEAGLNVLNIINEPTAAVLAYASKHPVNGNVMVYDLGGGTFDVTIAKVNGTDVECLTSEGDSELGGVDFDQKLAEVIDAKYREEYGHSLRDALGIRSSEDESKSEEWQTLILEAESIKRSLSKVESKRFTYTRGPDGPLRGEVTRQEFNKAIQGLVARAEMRIETAMENIDMTPSDIDVVLLVGGSTRVPAVRDSVKRVMGKEGSQEVNPDEAVALGASIYAGLKSTDRLKPMQREALSGVSVKDVANHYFGTIALGRDEHQGNIEQRVTIILKKDTQLPCSNTKRFFTASDGQQYIDFKLSQSAEEETDPEFVNIVFEKEIGPLPGGRPTGQPVDFTYRYDENQVMWIEMRDVESGLIFKETYKIEASREAPISIPDFRID
jgi:molecular chaperone DnaK